MRIKFKKGMSIILVMLMVMGGLNGLFVGGDKAYAAVAFAGGTGTIADPYQIETAAQLDQVRNHLEVGIYFELTADIDLSTYAGGVGWMAIGDNTTNFQGVMDGNVRIPADPDGVSGGIRTVNRGLSKYLLLKKLIRRPLEMAKSSYCYQFDN